jgi:hypothetical protein
MCKCLSVCACVHQCRERIWNTCTTFGYMTSNVITKTVRAPRRARTKEESMGSVFDCLTTKFEKCPGQRGGSEMCVRVFVLKGWSIHNQMECGHVGSEVFYFHLALMDRHTDRQTDRYAHTHTNTHTHTHTPGASKCHVTVFDWEYVLRFVVNLRRSKHCALMTTLEKKKVISWKVNFRWHPYFSTIPSSQNIHQYRNKEVTK